MQAVAKAVEDKAEGDRASALEVKGVGKGGGGGEVQCWKGLHGK